MRRRYHNRETGFSGAETVLVSTRIPKPIAEFMRDRVDGEDLKNLSECVQDAVVVWAMLEETNDA